MALPEIKDMLSGLKSTIVKTQTQRIDSKLDQAVKDISSYKSNSGRNGYINMVKSLIAKTADVKVGGGGAGGGLFQQGVGPSAFGQGGRIQRYKAYQAIVSNINYCYRALQVIVDNVLSPDDITKVSLEVNSVEYLEDEIPTAAKIRYIKEVMDSLKLDQRLDLIVRNTLLYGDFFCELGDANTALTSRSILTEAQYNALTETQFKNGDKERFVIKEGKERLEVSIDYSAFSEAAKSAYDGEDQTGPPDKKMTKKEKEKKQRDELRNLQLVFHEPHYVLALQSALFPICFGYLLFPPQEITGAGSIADETINNICVAILKNLERKIPQMREFRNDQELRDIIKSMVKQVDQNKVLEIRFVPTDRMTHFQVPTTKFYPYGESLFDSSQYSAKVIIALETALAIQRLSRSTEKRKIAIEIGLPRDARKAIEQMKEEFRKRKVSLDSFGTVDTIPSMITTFEDVYIPQKDGKPFVDVSTFTEGNVDTRSKVDEIKQMRDQLVAGYGVPPSFIGIEDNMSNKASLSEENILFARTIIRHQKYLSHQINDLMKKVFDIINPDESLILLDNISITFPIPKSLQYERESRYINELTNLIESLERIGIPREYTKRRYLAQLDWEEIKKYEIEEKVNKALDPTKDQDEMGMGMDMGMGGAVGGAPPPGGEF
jgi:hypothetical protein